MEKWIAEMESAGYKFLFQNGESNNPKYWFLSPSHETVDQYQNQAYVSSMAVERARGFYIAYNQGYYDKLMAALEAA